MTDLRSTYTWNLEEYEGRNNHSDDGFMVRSWHVLNNVNS